MVIPSKNPLNGIGKMIISQWVFKDLRGIAGIAMYSPYTFYA